MSVKNHPIIGRATKIASPTMAQITSSVTICDTSVSVPPVPCFRGLVGLNNLQTLDLGQNRVADISQLARFENLTRLIVRGNPLSGKSIQTHISGFRKRGIRVAWEKPVAK